MKNINEIPYDVEGNEKTPKLQRKQQKYKWKIMEMAQRYKDSQDYTSEILKYINIYFKENRFSLMSLLKMLAITFSHSHPLNISLHLPQTLTHSHTQIQA